MYIDTFLYSTKWGSCASSSGLGFPGSKILDNIAVACQLGVWAQDAETEGGVGYTLAGWIYPHKEFRYRCAGCVPCKRVYARGHHGSWNPACTLPSHGPSKGVHQPGGRVLVWLSLLVGAAFSNWYSSYSSTCSPKVVTFSNLYKDTLHGQGLVVAPSHRRICSTFLMVTIRQNPKPSLSGGI